MNSPQEPREPSPSDVEPFDPSALETVIGQLTAIRDDMLHLADHGLRQARSLYPGHQRSAANLLHYLALRRHDIRPLQRRLAKLGLSSLGRAESHALANIEAVISLLCRLVGRTEPRPPSPVIPQTEGEEYLQRNTESLLGPRPARRFVRVMVTLPGEAAQDYPLVRDLVAAGMNVARINLAHDGPEDWKRMVEFIRQASHEVCKPCRILMDLAGPKLRTGPMEPGPRVLKWRPRRDVLGRVTAPARLWLSADPHSNPPPGPADARVTVSQHWLANLCEGDFIHLRDARGAQRVLRVVECKPGGCWIETERTAYVTPETVFVHDPAGARPGGRTSAQGIEPLEQSLLLRPGDLLLLTRGTAPGRPGTVIDDAVAEPPRISLTIPEILDDLRPGEHVWLDDGKIGGVVEAVDVHAAQVRITTARSNGARLRADKGVNVPDSTLHLPPLMEEDLQHLPFVVAHADMVGYSFVRFPTDVHELGDRLEALGGGHLGVVLKIETREAFEHLPELLLAAMRFPSNGVMIARGDLAVECGWERLAEVQEEILWICEAGHVPVVWATQVLESLAKGGIPSRAEISDAAVGQRAECVMLNKGPHIIDAVQTLNDILQRMESHQSKKRQKLRPLQLARRFPDDRKGD